MAKNRTEVADIDRSLYDFRYGEEGFERLDAGLTPDIVREISERKNEPAWMLERRLKSLEIYHNTPNPTWGPGIEGLDMDHIVTYVKPNTDQKNDWESVPDDIKDTFERLGIPEAERSYLAGVGAQYDSELVYHNMQDTAAKMGIVYSGIEEALQVPEWEAIIREKFMTLIPPTDHKFAALHGAVWSGGSFVYVPKGVKLDFPLQSYFRLNAKGAGQFEHTLIVGRLPQEHRRLARHHHPQHAHPRASRGRPRPCDGQRPYRPRGRRLPHPLDRRERLRFL